MKNLLRFAEVKMRQKYGHRQLLKTLPVSKEINAMVTDVVRECHEGASRAPAPCVEIDLSRLDAIREAALHTQQKLILDDDADAMDDEALVTKPAVDASAGFIPVEAKPARSRYTLNALEMQFLACLVRKKPVGEFLREMKMQPSLLVDSINEKLYDEFQDTVIVFDGDTPDLLPDYAEAVTEIVEK